jgi:hypothetical protein
LLLILRLFFLLERIVVGHDVVGHPQPAGKRAQYSTATGHPDDAHIHRISGYL